MLRSRDEVDPELDTLLLEAIVDAETTSAGDGEVATNAILVALVDAIERGVGETRETVKSSVTAAADGRPRNDEDREA